MEDRTEGPSSASRSVRSIHSKIATSVRFINRSESHVKVIWLNYQGEQVLYSTLEPSSGYYDVNTFVTHPWIAVEEETNRRMLLNSRQMYFPKPPKIGHSEANAENHIGSSVMAQVIITPNVPCTLEECCKTLLKETVLPQNINQLPLPQTIIKDISQCA